MSKIIGKLQNDVELITEIGNPTEIQGEINSEENLEITLAPSDSLIGRVSSKNEIQVEIIGSGPSGRDGMDAYEMWLDQGNSGSMEDFFNSLKGVDGLNYIHPETHSADMIIPTNEKQFLTSEEKEKALSTFIHDQMVSSLQWTIAHNLDKYPSVSVVDTADSLVTGSVDYISKSTIVITFTAEFSGKAYLN